MSVRAERGSPAVVLGLLVALRVATSLAVLAASPGRLLPGLPRFRYDPLVGDAYGYYSCVREILSVWRRHIGVMAPVLLLVIAGVVVVWRSSPSRALRVEAVLVAAGLVAACLAALVRFTGAPQFGWPLLLSVVALPLRVPGLTSPGVVFAVGLAFALAANAATIVATWAIGRAAGLGARAALIPPALIAFWPFLALLTGPDAARNGSWQIDLGLSMYTEPVSTGLVTVALAMLLARRSQPSALVAGAMLGLATLIRVSNVFVVVCILAGLALIRDWPRARAVALGGLPWLPAALLFWPKGYPKLHPPTFPAHPLAWHYADAAWTKSYLWHPSVLLVLVPMAVLGCFAVRQRAGLLLWPSVVATALFYTFYELTPIHPRFLFVVLPITFVLWVGGAQRVVTTIARR